MAINVVTDPATATLLGMELYRDPEKTYKAARDILYGGSVLAKEILSKVEANPQFVINVVVTNSFVSMFMDEELNTTSLKGGVVTWDPTYSLSVNGAKQQPYMALAHELGHVVQYMDNRGWYRSYTRLYLGRLDPKFDCLGRSASQLEQAKKNAQLVIENDNISKHEAPIARQLGQPVRESYS